MKTVVTIDRNEQKALRFSKTIKWYKGRGATGQTVIVRTERKVLPAGDYCLKGEAESCLIERKGSLQELSQNLLSEDYTRAMDAFQRLSDTTANPYLVVECAAAELRTPTRWCQEPARIVDSLCGLMERFGFRLILCGKCVDVKQKRTVGDLMLRLMLAHAYQQEVDTTCDTVIAKLTSELEHTETPTKGRGSPA